MNINKLANKVSHYKDTIGEFLKNYKDLGDIKASDINNMLLDVLSKKVNGRKIKIVLKTTNYVATVLNRAGHNFNIALLILVLNVSSFNVEDLLKKHTKTMDVTLYKMVYLDVYRLVCALLSANNRELILRNLGSIFDYLYVIKS